MAEGIAAELITLVLQKLGNEALKQYVRSKGIHSELKNLEKKLSEIKNLLNDASDKENGDPNVKQWLNDLQHLAYDIDDILDGLATDAMHQELNTSMVRKFIPTCCTDFSLSNRFSHKLDSIATKLQALEKKKDSLGLIVKDEKPKNTSRIYESYLPYERKIVGREGDKKKLLHKLLGDEPYDQKFGVVPIVGMGGVGKTTLARVLYNETQVKEHFDLRAWVCVSNDFDVLKITKNIFEEVTREENKEFETLNDVQMALTMQLKEKRFLLVLDDVWSENFDDWENLVSPLHSCAPGSKIIITTRTNGLLKQLDFGHLDAVTSLSPDDALSLLAFHALGEYNFDSHQTLKRQGEGIVKKCGGLPLALKVIGGLLWARNDVKDWDYVLNSEIWCLEIADEIVQALRLSYHDLPGCLKQLFAYCSLFPKDFMFDKDDLVLLWMAEGFLNKSSGSMSMERLGHEYFDMLLSRSFFQQAPNNESLYVMHDLMNDLAVIVAGDYFLRFDNQSEREEKALAKYHHMSFIREEYVGYKKFETFKKAKSLRTFLPVSVEKSWDHFYLSNKILVDLLPQIPLLRVLSLSCFKIKELPDFIGSLKHLRYLNLSQTEITELPENVCNLYNLQTLIVFGCHKLSKLPTSFIKLKNLLHFDIRDTPLLKKMPLGISELNNLQTLTKIVIGGDDGFAISELKKIKNLHGKISIEGLDRVKNTTYARDMNFSEYRLTELELEWSEVFDGSRNEATEKEVLSELKPHSDKLKKLSIKSYGGKEFPNWVGDKSFLRLIQVSINGCRKCSSLPSLAQLPSLKELNIEDMNEVKVVSLELPGVACPSLEILRFRNMNGWEVWSSNSGVVFPRLRELSISGCPNLVEVSFEILPSLRVVEIYGCGDGVLRSIVGAAPSVTKLVIDNISGLSDEAWKEVMRHLGAVEELIIKDCNEIRYLWESQAQAGKVLVNLKELKVSGCSKMVSLGEKEEEEINCGSNLLLKVWHCESMKHCVCGNSIESLSIRSCWSMTYVICGNSIESLGIESCSSLTSVSFPTTTTSKATGGGTEEQKKQKNLKSLFIWDCEKLLMIKELGGGEQNINNITSRKMGMLESVNISNWQNLKSLNELSYSIHLTDLYIMNCKSLESIPNRELVNLISLKHLEITNCPSMDVSFPGGYWPPKLCSLIIGRLKKPISEWGNQNFPTSLVQLRLYDEEDDEECINISQLSALVPSSLTFLSISDFKKLERVSTGLHHLTSLQHLSIYNCPKIKDLPESLLPSLLSLQIKKCPNLEERIKGRGSRYSPLISHIPCIVIDEEISSSVSVEGTQSLNQIRNPAVENSDIMESRAVEDKIYVAVGKDLKKSLSTLNWALNNSGRKQICIFLVHTPAETIPFMGMKFRINQLKADQVTAYHEKERQDIIQLLDKYNQICKKSGVSTEAKFIEMDSIEKGIVEFIRQHNVTNLVMGAAADGKFSRRMVEPRSKKAIYVRLEAAASCQIHFIYKGNIVFTRLGSRL